ncbi:hypothetical protein [Aliivibrio fischeri]|uniref:hypothetical protein n=1 Tax=Aliivibrio fischeri TaxID=668 RepID=UPI0012D8A8B9|nr:hypothetical protein [Aliivibrio fischeri]MUJ20411.1 hypothetical protein [Aliivibrio fischeri]
MNKPIKPITYNPFEPIFSILSKMDSSGCKLEQRSNLMLRKVEISKRCVFWAPVGVTFVASESCIYVRKMESHNLIINQKFSINKGLKNDLSAYKAEVASSVLKAVRALQDAIGEYENSKFDDENSLTELCATLKVRLDKEKSITYIPRVTVTINFSGSQRASKTVSRTLNKFNSTEFEKLITQFVSYKNQCIDSGEILPISIQDISVTDNDIKLLSERSKDLFEHALISYLSDIEDASEVRGKIITNTNHYTLEYGNGLVKSYALLNYFNDEKIRLLVTRVCDFHMSNNAKHKLEQEKNKIQLNNCIDKIQPSSGLKGILVTLDRRSLCVLIHGIVGKQASGSYKTKQKKIINGNLKDAFHYALNAHHEAYDLPTLSKNQFNAAYATLQFAILSKVPDSYLVSLQSALEGVSSVVSITDKKFNDQLPKYKFSCESVTKRKFKKTGMCGVNVQVNNSVSLVSATVSICQHQGRIQKTFSIKTHGLFHAFVMAITAYRAGFNLPTLTDNELNESFIVFKNNVYCNIPEDLHYKLNKNFYSDGQRLINSKITDDLNAEMTREEAVLILATLREKKEELLKITRSRSESDMFFGIVSPIDVDVLTSCSACGHKYVESHDETGFSVVCSSCTRGARSYDKQWMARLNWNLLNWRDISSLDIPHFNLKNRNAGDNFQYLKSVREFFVANLELIKIQLERNNLIRRFNITERKKKIAGRGYQERFEAYVMWVDISLKVIEKERYLLK